MLSLDNAVPFLLKRGLVTPRSITEGDLVVTSAMRRNRNLRVTRRDGPGYLVKQSDDPGFGGTLLECEASFYRLCHTLPAAAPMTPLLPAFERFDPGEAALVIELVEDAVPLSSVIARASAADFPVGGAGALGRALGTLHRTFAQPGPVGAEAVEWMRRDLPSVFGVHRPGPEMLADANPGILECVRIVQTQKGFAGALDALALEWSPATVVHNDVKFDNVLLAGGGPRGVPRVLLVDWELVQLGDPAWDVAGALHDFVLSWITSMPAAPTPETMADGARLPLAVLQRAIRALWRGYREAAGVSGAAAAVLLDRAVRFSGARLVQAAIETAQAVPALPQGAAFLLQVSANLLLDPDDARLRMYGLFGEVDG